MGFLYPELDAPPSTNPTLHVLPSQCVQHHGASVFSAGKGKTIVRKKASLEDHALRNLIVNFLFIMNYFQDRALNVLQVLTNFLLVHPILGYSFNLEIVGLIGGSFAARLLSCFRCWPRGCSLCSRRHSSTVSLTSASSPRLNELLLRLPSVLQPRLPDEQTTPHKLTQPVDEFNDTLPLRASPLLLAVVVLVIVGHFPTPPPRNQHSCRRHVRR